jgi:preprotein translocase subunit SecG
MSTFSIFMILIILVSLLLVLAIMVQNPKGGGLSSSFGGGGGQNIGGVQKTSDFLDKSTWTLSTILVALILLSSTTVTRPGAAADSRALDGAPEVEQTIPVTPNQNQVPDSLQNN